MSRVQSAQFRRLYSSHFRLVWSVIGQLGLYGAAREDAAQEIWIVVVRRLHTLDPDASERAWLCAIAKKVVWRLRRNTRRFDARVAAFAEAPRLAPADASTRYEAVTTAAEALRSLTDAQRRVLVLTLVHGFTAPEVSAALGVPLNTVYSRLRLARQRIAAFDVKRRELEDALEPRESPSAEVRQRVLRAVLPWTQAPWVAVSTIKAFALGGALGGVLATAGGSALAPPATPARAALLVSSEPQEAVSSVPSRVHVETAAADPVAALPESPHRKPARSVGPVAEPPVAEPPVADAPEPEPLEGSESEPGPVLDDESRLLARAQRALRSDEPQQAVRLLRQHELQFADGRLVDVREGALVRALCALGRTDEAARVRRRLSNQRPGSAVATAVADVCAQAGDGSTPRRR
ncbi:MAG: sigma-70 family RNA polymerase sigma factor [Nannocystales bacterium]